MAADPLDFLTNIADNIGGNIVPDFVPTGIMEPLITAVGRGEHRIIVAQTANKVGKSAHVVRTLGEIFWPSKNIYFQDPVPELGPYPMFKKWWNYEEDRPYEKRFRFLFTKENASDLGPLWIEAKKWWPKGRYTTKNKGANYIKEIRTDTGWIGDILTQEQDSKQFEGPLVSLMWIDEPPKHWQLSAMNARMSEGGVLIISMTPLKAGAVVDVIEDIEAEGTKVTWINGELKNNSITSGTPNSRGTKRGLLTDIALSNYEKSIPRNEKEERSKGKTSHKAGRLYSPPFGLDTHVISGKILDHPDIKNWNTYMVLDPHRKAYPFMTWFAITPDEKVIVYNEWPNYAELGDFYDKIRPTVQLPNEYDTSRLSQIIKISDGSSWGLPKPRRFIDPRFAKAEDNEWTKSTEGLVLEYARPENGIDFELPPFELIQTQRDKLINLLHYDRTAPKGPGNTPDFLVLDHCVNIKRSLERHYWEDSKENETYKDPIDTIRYFLAGIGGEVRYQAPSKPQKRTNVSSKSALDYLPEGGL